ncbi:MAG: Cof-type HAD-IIB family hydrolase [Lactobacillaceae bacterium]|jgi:Cof subfamily protein (haloacid dehalogenase superfamily)|nr:Cof-type HAD-IIB family hydrolase [Lactobacillaceae bacterium]
MTIKLITIDVDGTLNNSQGKVSDHTVEVLKKAIAKGAKIVIASGRPLDGTKHFYEMLGIDNSDDQFAINYNGAMAMTTSGKILIEETLKVEDYLEIANFADSNDVKHQIETATDIITPFVHIPKYSVYESALTNAPIWYRPLADLESSLPVAKVMLIDEKDKIDTTLSQMPQKFLDKYNVVRSSEFFIEFIKKTVSKGNALKRLAEGLGLSLDETMSIGDQGNDLSMIEAAGTGVAMGNAVDEVKAAAQFVTKTNDEDGVAFAIEKFVLDV